jgi:hypothetical protein
MSESRIAKESVASLGEEAKFSKKIANLVRGNSAICESAAVQPASKGQPGLSRVDDHLPFEFMNSVCFQKPQVYNS